MYIYIIIVKTKAPISSMVTAGQVVCTFFLARLHEVQKCYCTDKQNALRRECTFKIEIVLEIGVAGVNIYLKLTVLTLLDVLSRLAQSVRPWRMVINI